ncbi:hypothetical protein LCGC14_2792100 [marine sediment metagenome]|uniref:Uncharacterized protein n=1 Tax=marine sediment metagenome TaxID=412755 RepID=A0A0F9BGL9_9ZZZZ
MAQLIHIVHPKTDKRDAAGNWIEIKEWVVIDLQDLSEEDIIKEYCRGVGEELEIASIVEIEGNVATFPAHQLLSA